MASLVKKEVLVFKAKCKRICDQSTEEIAAAFDENVAGNIGGGSNTALTKLLHSYGYELLEAAKPERLVVVLAPKDCEDVPKRGGIWCPLRMPGAPPMLCTLEGCHKYERGCYAIRNIVLDE